MSLWSTASDACQTAVEQVYAETVTYSRTGVADQYPEAIYGTSYVKAEMGGEVGVMSASPSFDVRADQLAVGFVPKQGDIITRTDGTVWEVIEVQPDQEAGWKILVVESE